MKKFEEGKIYKHHYITDRDTEVFYKVIKRTAKTITIENQGTGEVIKGKRVKEWDGTEIIKPEGTYSMAPTLRAENEVK